MKVYQLFTDNGYKVGQLFHDGLTVELYENCPYSVVLSQDVIDKVNDAINEVGSKYKYENIMSWKNIWINNNILGIGFRQSDSMFKSGFMTFKNPSMHRTVIDGHSHIPYKITGEDEFVVLSQKLNGPVGGKEI